MLLFIVYVVLSASGLILFKLGSADLSVGFQNSLISASVSLTMILGILSYLASFILWLFIVNKSSLSYVYPLSIAFINIVILVGSYFILNEEITVRSLIGAAIIIVGVVVLKA